MTEKVPMLLSVTHRVWICDGTVWPTENTLLMMSQEKEARSSGKKRPADIRVGDKMGNALPASHTQTDIPILRHNN